MLLLLLLIDSLLLLLLLLAANTRIDRIDAAGQCRRSMSPVGTVGLLIEPDRWFVAAELLSSIADAPPVAADRSTTVVAAMDPAERENYDKSINQSILLIGCRCF